MKVLKRNGDSEDVSFDKVINRIKALSYELETVDPVEVAQKVCARIYDGVRTSELDELAASICSSMMVTHPDYGKLASRICVSNHHKNTSPSFSETIGALWANVDEEGRGNPLVSAELYDVVMKNKDKLNAVIDYGRDFDFDFFGFKTLERSYLFRVKGRVVERPQHMFMRVALGIHGSDVKDAIQTYNLMSRKYFIHATPTLFNAGTRTPQLSSCFLMNVSDSIADENGIYEALKEFAVISKNAGGMGMNIHDIRGNGSLIRGTNGTSTGIVPMLRVFNNTCRYVNQGGRRKGSNAVYIEPWHADIEAFLELRKPHGNEEERCRDLFLALWVNDLFMKRVRDNGVWSLFCPNVARGLTTSHGEAFEKLYLEYEAAGKYMKQVPAQKLWFKILESQIESGQPYMLYKDHANAKSNQKNLGTIKSSNLCVAPETMVLTEKGSLPIYTLVGQDVRVWNGEEFSDTVVHQTGFGQKLITVYFSNDKSLRCTPYHKFFVMLDGEMTTVDASELKVGMQLMPYKLHAEDKLHAVCVTQVEDTGDVDDTYCFNEPKKHAGIFNGILTGQCSEIIEYSDEKETAVCNLASLALPSFVEKGEDGVVRYNFDMLHEVAKVATKNLNKVIDINYYPVAKCRRSNLRHRPIGIGVQGLADVFIKMRMPFDSAEAKALNRDIFETIYHAAVECSMEIARKRATEMAKWGGDGEYCLKLNEFEQECMRGPWPGSYSTFAGSPASEGKLQFDLWGIAPSDRYDWAALKADVMKWGMRNSLLMAPMPTASTSQILGFNECFEPITSNIYKRKTLAGEFIMVNNYLVQDLIALGLWTKDIQDQIVINDGSIQEVDAIPKELKELYKTVWEIKQRVIIDMAADRGAFVCQSQSMNLFMEDPDFKKLTSMHFYAWERGLKTGMYYLRSKPKAQAQKFAIDPSKMKLSNLKSGDAKKIICTDEVCTVCSS